jgi:hypothetical protein
VAGRVLEIVGVVEIRLLVHSRPARRARPGRGHGAGRFAPRTRLEGVGEGRVPCSGATGVEVHQEDRDRARRLWKVPFEILRGDQPIDAVQLEPAGIGNVVHGPGSLVPVSGTARAASSGCTPLPDGERLAVSALDLRLLVVSQRRS